ncbi:MAG: GntR family transcriptional regulator [Actinomycetaceae bacterium]|nr:GntR family transcriptional regulator [Actinomycetaceae bacterium]MDY6082275.1 GntR family transcriptional regulator [Actinomycetaceae bacterium]
MSTTEHPGKSAQSLDVPFAPDITIDRLSPVPLYEQIAQPIADMIKNQIIQPGQLIEDEVSLSDRLDVSRPTARRALQELARVGLLVRRRGAGTRVTPVHVQRQLRLTSLDSDLRQAGHTTSTKVLSYETLLADAETATKLQCEQGSEIVSVTRILSMDDSPLVVMHNIIPASIAPSLTALSQKSLYDSFIDLNVVPETAVQNIGARNATKHESELLELSANAAILTMERFTFDDHHNVIEHGDHIYNAEHYSVTIPLVA